VTSRQGVVCDFIKAIGSTENPAFRLPLQSRNVNLPLAFARDATADHSVEVTNGEDEDVTLICWFIGCWITGKDVCNEEVCLVDLCSKLVLSEETPRRKIEMLTFPCRTDRIELAEFDLNLPIEPPSCRASPQNKVDLIDIEKSAVWIPALLEELKLSVRLP